MFYHFYYFRHSILVGWFFAYYLKKQRSWYNIENYKCPICGNTNPSSIGIRNGHPYCRRCISFRGEEVKGDLSYPKGSKIFIDYDLSIEQKNLSRKILNNYKEGKNTLVHAVCGSGKTEIVLEVIQYAIKCGERVGFAIPRRDVVIEIHQRFSSIFKNNKVVAIYGGHTLDNEGDLVVLTTHQLYRYYHYFDLLIVDEIDAFPFKNNDVLKSFFYRSIKNKYVLMSATPSSEILKKFSSEGYEVVELFSRFHRYPLPVPILIKGLNFYLFYKLITKVEKYIKEDKQVMVFTPTIEVCEVMFSRMKLFIKGGDYVHSKRKDRAETINRFRNKETKYIVTTAVLERGVTVRNVQVVVYLADHMVYDRHTLIQIAGRVGRKKDAPEGEVIFLANQENEEIINAIEEIERANRNLQDLF